MISRLSRDATSPRGAPDFTLRLFLAQTVAFCLGIRPALAYEMKPPKSIDGLRTSVPTPLLIRERDLAAGEGFTAYLVSYVSEGLKLYAMISIPTGNRPQRGFPVVVANHGTHSNPPRYGYSEDGRDLRPGDYYRSIPLLFSTRGFIVVMPDYRGHNISAGAEYVGGRLSPAYYAEDVVALLATLPQIENADVCNVFMWGHSMGCEVSLRALLASPAIRAASLWSTIRIDICKRAEYCEKRNSSRLVQRLRKESDALDQPLIANKIDLADLSAVLNIHHAVDDQSTLLGWS